MRMTATIRAALAATLVAFAVVPGLMGHAQAQPVPTPAPATTERAPAGAQTAEPAGTKSSPDTRTVNGASSAFAEDGLVETAWATQLDSLWHALARLPTAALLSAILAFRPRRRGTPKRQAPVIQTQIILAIVGAMVMLVVGTSLARAFGIVGAAGLIRYRAKIEDPKDAGVMLSTLAIGLAAGVGLYLFAIFATVFVLGVLRVIESIDPEPYQRFELAISAKDAVSLKESIEGLLRQRRIAFELRSTSPDEICYEVKLPLDIHTDSVSEALMKLNPQREVNVKWDYRNDAK
jgi:uncharacterized membrane protein YhiD involved in acid resistance